MPRLWSRPLYSQSLANLHFWLGLTGILLDVFPMWASGISQGLMLNATAENGTILKYPNFLETLTVIRPLMLFRVVGGTIYLGGFVLILSDQLLARLVHADARKEWTMRETIDRQLSRNGPHEPAGRRDLNVGEFAGDVTTAIGGMRTTIGGRK